MSTFSPQAPASGWQKRWPKEAFQLMLRTPLIVAVVIAVSLGVGFVDTMIADPRANLIFHGASLLIVGVPLLTWIQHALGKHENYISGSFDYYPELFRMLIPAVIVISVFVVIALMLISSDPPSPAQRTDNALMQSWFTANFIITTPMMFVYRGMFVLLVVPLVNAGVEENKIIAEKSHEKLLSVWPHVTIQTLFILVLCRSFLPPYLVMFIIIFAYYVIYVAGREIIGGITGNTQESRTPVLAPT